MSNKCHVKTLIIAVIESRLWYYSMVVKVTTHVADDRGLKRKYHV